MNIIGRISGGSNWRSRSKEWMRRSGFPGKSRMSDDRRHFVDTNVLLYVLDGRNSGKQKACRNWMDRLWELNTGRISWQVVHEFYVNAVRKLGVPSGVARGLVQTYALWQPVESTAGLVGTCLVLDGQGATGVLGCFNRGRGRTEFVRSVAERGLCAWPAV